MKRLCLIASMLVLSVCLFACSNTSSSQAVSASSASTTQATATATTRFDSEAVTYIREYTASDEFKNFHSYCQNFIDNYDPATLESCPESQLTADKEQLEKYADALPTYTGNNDGIVLFDASIGLLRSSAEAYAGNAVLVKYKMGMHSDITNEVEDMTYDLEMVAKAAESLNSILDEVNA